MMKQLRKIMRSGKLLGQKMYAVDKQKGTMYCMNCMCVTQPSLGKLKNQEPSGETITTTMF